MLTTNSNGRLELEAKITEAEIDGLAHQPGAHLGESKSFRDLLSLLISVNAFGPGVTAASVAQLLYADSGWKEPTPAQDKAGKKPTTYGDRRLGKIRYGNASITRREGAYFQAVFRHAFGDEWADLIALEALITMPLKDLLSQLRQSNLPGPWNRLDPVQALHVLEAGQPATAPLATLSVQGADETRLSHQGDGATERLRPLEVRPTMAMGERYYLNAQLPEGCACLALEYSADPLQVTGKAQWVQGQMLGHQESIHEGVRFTAKDYQPLIIAEQPGGFGFCIITYPEVWDAQEYFGMPATGLLAVADCQALVRRIRQIHLKGAEVGLSLYDYVVPPPS